MFKKYFNTLFFNYLVFFILSINIQNIILFFIVICFWSIQKIKYKYHYIFINYLFFHMYFIYKNGKYKYHYIFIGIFLYFIYKLYKTHNIF